MAKMGKSLPLKRLMKFLLEYRTTPHTMTEMRPDELFLHRRARTRLILVQPDLGARVERHRLAQKRTHDNTNCLPMFAKGASVMVRNHWGNQKWVPGCIIKQKGPVRYLVRVGSRVRYCHVEHLLRTKVLDSNSNAKMQIDEQIPVELTFQTDEPEVVTNQPRTVPNSTEPQRSTHLRREPQRLIETMNT